MATPNPLKAYREAKGLAQQEVADKLGVSRAMVGHLESGAREFTPDMAVRCEKKLGIPREDLLPEFFRKVAA
jgi:transcriptional regulator with XRE-family HTH domain